MPINKLGDGLTRIMEPPKQIMPSWVVLVTAVLCFVAIADLPYNYYRILRWTVCATAIFSAIQMHRSNRLGWVWILGAFAVVFNPIFLIHFDKSTWRTVDLAAGILFLCVFRMLQTLRRSRIS